MKQIDLFTCVSSVCTVYDIALFLSICPIHLSSFNNKKLNQAQPVPHCTGISVLVHVPRIRSPKPVKSKYNQSFHISIYPSVRLYKLRPTLLSNPYSNRLFPLLLRLCHLLCDKSSVELLTSLPQHPQGNKHPESIKEKQG